MKFSEQWLRSWVNPQVSREELVARLSMVGLEVDAVTPVAGSFNGVVVGEVLETAQHPDADKLRVCQVSNGQETFQVVCGAPNVRPGLKIPFAMIGAQLPGDFKIKKAKLRGVESNGMLCSETELQVGGDDSGLMELAAERPDVMVGAGDETLRGELRTASTEVVTLAIADERREPISIALAAIDHVVVRSR